MGIRVFPTNADLPVHLRWQIISIICMQCYAIAGDYRGPAALPDEWHPCHVVGTEGDAIVSYAGVVWRDIEHAGQAFRAYGLSSVFTFPALRRCGFGTEVVRFATARIREAADADVALLFARPGLQTLYERNGWQALPSTAFLVGSETGAGAPARRSDDAVRLAPWAASSLRLRARQRLLRPGCVVVRRRSCLLTRGAAPASRETCRQAEARARSPSEWP
jgi:GNAT superfamily N-acetyltransferase